MKFNNSLFCLSMFKTCTWVHFSHPDLVLGDQTPCSGNAEALRQGRFVSRDLNAGGTFMSFAYLHTSTSSNIWMIRTMQQVNERCGSAERTNPNGRTGGSCSSEGKDVCGECKELGLACEAQRQAPRLYLAVTVLAVLCGRWLTKQNLGDPSPSHLQTIVTHLSYFFQHSTQIPHDVPFHQFSRITVSQSSASSAV